MINKSSYIMINKENIYYTLSYHEFFISTNEENPDFKVGQRKY